MSEPDKRLVSPQDRATTRILRNQLVILRLLRRLLHERPDGGTRLLCDLISEAEKASDPLIVELSGEYEHG